MDESKEEEKAAVEFTDKEQKAFYKHIGGKPPKPGKEKFDPFKNVIKTLLVIFEGKIDYKESKEKVGLA